jgi:4-hydroxybenzoate polyprenyltransferase
MIAYFKLFRADAAIIGYGGYLAGAHIARGVALEDFLIAFLVSAFSANFCYSFNSWADWRIDRINKPNRPIPAGRVSPGAALRYSIFLLAGSIIFPFFAAQRLPALLLLLAIPVIGFLYSARPFRLKVRPPFSVLAVSAGLVIPFAAGWANNTAESYLWGFFVSLILFCASLVGLKDIEDIEGDAAAGEFNLYLRFGDRLLDGAVVGLALTALCAAALGLPGLLRLWLFVLCAVEAGLVLLHRFGGWNTKRLYRRVIIAVEVIGTALTLYLWYAGPQAIFLS